MDFPPTFTARTFSLSLLPPHLGQGRIRMNRSRSRRRYSERVWLWSRSAWGTSPSHLPVCDQDASLFFAFTENRRASSEPYTRALYCRSVRSLIGVKTENP